MIVGEQKPFDEIWEMIKGHKQLNVFGCNTCVAVCHQGGNKEAEILASLLRMRATQDGVDIEIINGGIERQCEHPFFESGLRYRCTVYSCKVHEHTCLSCPEYDIFRGCSGGWFLY